MLFILYRRRKRPLALVTLPSVPTYVTFSDDELSKLNYSLEPNNNPASNIELLKKIGEGQFGVVWSAKWNGADVAIKFFENLSKEAKEEQMQEFELMK